MKQSNSAIDRRARLSVFIERKPFQHFTEPSIQARMRSIDTSSDKWQVGESQPTLINFARIEPHHSPFVEMLIHQVKFFIARELSRKSPKTVASLFDSIQRFLNAFDWSDAEQQTHENLLLENLFFYIHINRKHGDEFNLNSLRYWYQRSYLMGLNAFNQQGAQALSTFRFRGNLKGADVLSAIPNAGPLSAYELDALKLALREFKASTSVSDPDFPGLMCTWLIITLGIRGLQAALLMRSDFAINTNSVTGEKHYLLNVPSVKKRHASPRTQFKQRELPAFLGNMMDEYLKFTKSKMLAGRTDDDTPMLPILQVQRRKAGAVLDTYLQTHIAGKITILLQKLMTRLNQSRVSQNKLPLVMLITCRRLRKTFATKAAAVGVPIVELAELLDHEDLQHVMVYYKFGLDFAERLDRVMSQQFKDILSYFNGEISFTALVDKSLPNAVFGPDRLRRLVGIGMCAKGAPCNLTPPNACYVCPKFEACNDPNIHREVLGSMQEDIKHQFGEDAPPELFNAPHILACRQLVAQLEVHHE